MPTSQKPSVGSPSSLRGGKRRFAAGELWCYDKLHGRGQPCQACGLRSELPFCLGSQVRKLILQGAVAEGLKEVFEEIAERYELKIGTMEVMEDHVHIFLSSSPRYSPSEVLKLLKSISAWEVFRRYPEVKEQLWGCGTMGTLYDRLGMR